MKKYIEKIISGEDLTRSEAYGAMIHIMEGKASDTLISAMLIALKIKGESVEEISGFSEAMLEKAEKVVVSGGNLVDTCGTGGDGLNTFNISTTAAFIAAGAGVRIAKHGNRSVSSRSGSADVLEELGININLDVRGVSRCIEEAGIGFIFAPMAHSAMKYVAGVRKELGIRTVFNILGPITNPALANGRVLGVYDAGLIDIMVGALKNLGVERAFVICSENGMDEFSTTSRIRAARLMDGKIERMVFEPADYGFKKADIGDLAGGDAAMNAKILENILSGRIKGPMRDSAVLNAAAAIVTGKAADRIEDGIDLAIGSIDSGRALEKLNELIDCSNRK
ncbi:MAG: anthranilate phosphoribosyltransferase [Actinobacteria bacterium]|nr:anthranilate phosphoribosyltransferase [Actinomycetota bacterium]